MTTVHLVTGNVGAGKTTYSIALAQRLGAIRFSIDEWMATLFHADQPASLNLEWTLELLERIEKQIWSLIPQIAVDVVLDLGLSMKAHRDLQRSRAAALGLRTKLHYLEVDLATRRSRVSQRNSERGDSFAFEVTEEMIDFMEGWFEPPSAGELSD
jgi:predicted kinase